MNKEMKEKKERKKEKEKKRERKREREKEREKERERERKPNLDLKDLKKKTDARETNINYTRESAEKLLTRRNVPIDSSTEANFAHVFISKKTHQNHQTANLIHPYFNL